MSTSGRYDLYAVASAYITPRHKQLANDILSCSLNHEVVLEFINDPLIVPRSLRSTGDFNECEHPREPDHRLVSAPWHAYIPVQGSVVHVQPGDVKEWVFQDSTPSC